MTADDGAADRLGLPEGVRLTLVERDTDNLRQQTERLAAEFQAQIDRRLTAEHADVVERRGDVNADIAELKAQINENRADMKKLLYAVLGSTLALLSGIALFAIQLGLAR